MNSRSLLALALFTIACDDGADEGSDPESWQFPQWSSKEDQLGAGLTATHDQNVMIFDGYNKVVDRPVGRNCVLPKAGALEVADFRAGGDLMQTDLKYITTRRELEQALDIDAAAKIKVGPLGGGGGLGISRTFKTSDKTVSILLRARHVYTVINQERHHLTDEALAMLEADPAEFMRACGTDYLAGVAYGAELVALVQIEGASLQKKQEIQSKLEAAGIKAGPASLDGSLGAKFQQALADESNTVSVWVEARGFTPSVDLSGITKLDESSFSSAAEAVKQLHASVQLDKCHDQGDAGPGTCGGTKARGYLGNGARVSVPMGLLRQQFQRTANFPASKKNVDGLLAVARTADQAVAVLADYADLYDAIVAIWADEVHAMVASDRPYDFGVYDTSGAMHELDFATLQQHASDWADAFDPVSGSEVQALAELVQSCWSRAEFGDYGDCAAKAKDTAIGQGILASIGEYAETRIRPVLYAASSDAVEFGDAPGECGAGWRMPNRAETNRLFFAIERNPDVPEPVHAQGKLLGAHAAWYDDGNVDCSAVQGAWLERRGDGTFGTGCYTDGGIFVSDLALPVLCVPKAGVYGSDVPKLPAL
jgi:hypothetical protein